MLSRRHVLAGLAGVSVMPLPAMAAPTVLRAQPARQQIAPAQYGQTDLWTFGGSMPGQLLRARQGSRLEVRVETA